MSQLVRNTFGIDDRYGRPGRSILCRQSIVRSISRHRVNGSDRDGRPPCQACFRRTASRTSRKR